MKRDFSSVLTLSRIIRRDPNHRSSRDQRRRVCDVIAEYVDSDGNCYRKAFESDRSTKPFVPSRGTHATLNALHYQAEASTPDPLDNALDACDGELEL